MATFTAYIGDLFAELVDFADDNKDLILKQPPPPLCQSFPHPVKEEAIKEHQSRFKLE